jgi:glycosyltransferase involved in cell wall biosynthesis
MVMDSYPPDSVGGAERIVHGWSRELAARGHEVWVLAGRIGLPAGPDGERAGYRVRWWTSKRRTFLDGYASTIQACKTAAQKLAGEVSFDLAHLHQGLSAFAVSRAGLGIPQIWTFHGPWHEEFVEDARARKETLPTPLRPVYGLAARIKASRLFKMEKHSVSRCLAGAVLSQYSRERLAAAHGLVPEQIEVLPAGAETERFFPLPDTERERVRQRLGFQGPTVVSVRRLVRRMGLDLLIHAWPQVCSKVPDARLVLVGKGPERRPLEDLAERLGVGDAVRFAGFVPEEELPDYYRAADLFVLPTRSLEGYGVATLEALASGTPVVGTLEGATPEILRPLEGGLLAEDVEPATLAAAMLRWLTAPQALAGLRIRSRQYVEKNFSWDESGRALEEFYVRVLRG